MKGNKSAPDSTSKPSKDESTLAEFMKVMKPRTKKDRSWANDPDPSTSTSTSTLLPEASTASAVAKRDPNAFTTTKSAKSNGKGKERIANDDDDGLPTESADNGEAISDLEWMRRRMASSALDSETAPRDSIRLDQDEDVTMPIADSKPPVEDADTGPSEDSVAELLKESPRLYLRNLAYSCTTADLEEAFTSFGPIVQVDSESSLFGPIFAYSHCLDPGGNYSRSIIGSYSFRSHD